MTEGVVAGMGRYLLRRVLQLVPVFLVATFAIFAVVRVLPGDPVQAQFGERAVPESLRAQLVDQYHLDESLVGQYGHYLADILTLDLGDSISLRRPVGDVIGEAWPRTASLALLAIFFQALFAVPAGLVSARRAGSPVDRTLLVGSTVLLAVPSFLLALVAQVFLAERWDLFPVSGVDRGMYSYVLPALVLGTSMAAVSSRVLRTSLLETAAEEFVDAARARGLPERRVFARHVLPNALLPVVTVLAVDLGGLLGGAVVAESVFNIPGIGFQITRGIANRDTTLITGVTIVMVVVYLLISLVLDLVYAWLDPRIRRG